MPRKVVDDNCNVLLFDKALSTCKILLVFIYNMLQCPFLDCSLTRGVLFKDLPRHAPTFLIWNNLCDLVYQRPTRSYRSQTAVT